MPEVSAYSRQMNIITADRKTTMWARCCFTHIFL